MVAMKEMKKTTTNTQNGQHRHHHPHHLQTKSEQQLNVDVDVDVSVAQEDLSYGPGIVSKLRCRYLNLALRRKTPSQLLSQQQQRLRRSTSLNTLLDRNDDDDADAEANGDADAAIPIAIPVAVPIAVQIRTATATPPPIASGKPASIATTGSGYIKSVQQQTQNTTQPQQHSSAPSNGTAMLRARHFKRGNEVMKRARSVEALLCEKSPWNTQNQRAHSYQAATATTAAVNAGSISSSSSSAVAASVSIEDKISNARERLHSGTDTTPPKRLTSIIDDTERPPPDLVKQTLKMFEASANRRPRIAQRSNGIGGVASKVANYKSIIKEQKPINTNCNTNSSTNSKREQQQQQLPGFAASTPKQQTRLLNSNSHVPDIIPRQLVDVGATHSIPFDSPVTNLGKMLERMQLVESPTVDAVAAVVVGGENSQRCLVNSSSDKRSQVENEKEENNDDNNDDNGEGDDDANEGNDVDGSDSGAVYNGDKLGAAGGDKLKALAAQPPPPYDEAAAAAAAATTLAGGVGVSGVVQQRSFVAALQENAHVSSNSSNSCSINSSSRKQIGVIRPLLNNSINSSCGTPLTSREIEKNRINEMKKSTALAADAAAAAAVAATTTTTNSGTSLDTVINTNNKNVSETDAASSTAANAGISPIWPLRKRRQPTTGGASSSMNSSGSSFIGNISNSSIGSMDNNTSMVFNFSKSSKEVPDYIESDVVIYRRKRELPKPNEPGFVLLGDLSVETSTDTDYDDYSMCPPSPCDVEFENANIVIDGKSSIRQKSKDSSFRVQFNDTLTSTFEYPSEASQTPNNVDDPPYADPYGNVNKHHQLLYEEHLMLQHQLQQQQQQQQHHHHVTVDEIIELPTSTSTSTAAAAATSAASHKASATSGMLGNLPLGSTALGFYTPVKASPMDSLFQLGVTRYTTSDSSSSNSNSNNSNSNSNSSNGSPAGGTSFNGNGNGNGSVVGIGDGLIKDELQGSATAAAAEGVDDGAVVVEDYLPASTSAYSEGTQKTDLLY